MFDFVVNTSKAKLLILLSSVRQTKGVPACDNKYLHLKVTECEEHHNVISKLALTDPLTS